MNCRARRRRYWRGRYRRERRSGRFAPAGSAAPGAILQIGRGSGSGRRGAERRDGYRVTRAVHGSMAEAHAARTSVYRLTSRPEIAPFPAGFFGSPYSGSWSFRYRSRCARGERRVVRDQPGRATVRCAAYVLTHNDDRRAADLSGGQYSIQVRAFWRWSNRLRLPLMVETSHSVRDIYAVLGKAADATVQVQLKVDGARTAR